MMRFDAVMFLNDLFKADQPALAVDLQEDVRTPDDLPPYWREHYEERAGIRQYEGGQAREHAEAEALRETLVAMKREKDRSGG